ncbi:MAG: MarR family winged helix-turn-helix transcriptional regulator [Pseudonocardiaceae bacterium]
MSASDAQLADADALGQELVRLVRLVERARADYAARGGDGVERAAHLLLARLVAEGPQRLCALAEAVYSDPSTVSRQVAQLVSMGLVERRPDPRDGRAARLSATEAGQRTCAEQRRMRNERTAAMLAAWPPEDVRRLVELLDRLNTDFEEYRWHSRTDRS